MPPTFTFYADTTHVVHGETCAADDGAYFAFGCVADGYVDEVIPFDNTGLVFENDEAALAWL